MESTLLLILCFLFSPFYSSAQSSEKPFIKLTAPLKENNAVSVSRQYVVGSSCKHCSLMLNGKKVKVWPTGAFAIELNLSAGDTAFTLVAISEDGKSSSKRIHYNYTIPLPPVPVSITDIERIETMPEGDLQLIPGDKIQFRVKALPRSRVHIFNNMPLYEMPVTSTQRMPGIYQGIYQIKETDSFMSIKIPVTITDSTGNRITKETENSFSVLSPLASDVALTKGRLAHLEYGLGEDRLGGAKIGYIDSLIPLKITGKVGSHYRIRLAKTRTAYIPDDLVTLMPEGSFEPSALTERWRVYGDERYDYINIDLSSRVPYQSFQTTDPSGIMVDIFGATNNTNWITQLENAKEIIKVDYEQVADDIFRVKINLKHRQHWGHKIYYRGNTLVIKIRQQPRNLLLKNMIVAVDAGHGGSNTGAGGPTGVLEKDLTLAISLKLQKALEKEGATVIMTRVTESFFDNKERILFYRDSMPDLLVSIHLNSSSDPVNAGGTATFYRYPGFRSLSHSIYKRMLELGLKEYGNNSSFNFMLNSPTEYPNALVEALFLSNPEEEMKALDENFQEQIAGKIVQGIRDFLEGNK